MSDILCLVERKLTTAEIDLSDISPLTDTCLYSLLLTLGNPSANHRAHLHPHHNNQHHRTPVIQSAQSTTLFYHLTLLVYYPTLSPINTQDRTTAQSLLYSTSCSPQLILPRLLRDSNQHLISTKQALITGKSTILTSTHLRQQSANKHHTPFTRSTSYPHPLQRA